MVNTREAQAGTVTRSSRNWRHGKTGWVKESGQLGQAVCAVCAVDFSGNIKTRIAKETPISGFRKNRNAGYAGHYRAPRVINPL